jgi:hypothetical protein
MNLFFCLQLSDRGEVSVVQIRHVVLSTKCSPTCFPWARISGFDSAGLLLAIRIKKSQIFPCTRIRRIATVLSFEERLDAPAWAFRKVFFSSLGPSNNTNHNHVSSSYSNDSHNCNRRINCSQSWRQQWRSNCDAEHGSSRGFEYAGSSTACSSY